MPVSEHSRYCLSGWVPSFTHGDFGLQAPCSPTLDIPHLGSSNSRNSSNYNGPSSIPEGDLLGLLSARSALAMEESDKESDHIIFIPTNSFPSFHS